jgi:hypothetical protein
MVLQQDDSSVQNNETEKVPIEQDVNNTINVRNLPFVTCNKTVADKFLADGLYKKTRVKSDINLF